MYYNVNMDMDMDRQALDIRNQEDNQEDHDFSVLCTTPGIEIHCRGDASVYTTTGMGTVRCGKKEYPISEQHVETQSGRMIYMTFVDFGPAVLPVRCSARTEIAQTMSPPTIDEARICRGILQGTLLPTREEFFRALEAFDGGGKNGKLMNFCLEHELYEILTKEYIEALAAYLEERIRVLREKTGKTVTILEVGAGDGRLTHFLREELDRRGVMGYRIIASDGGQWRIAPHYPVEREDVATAVWDFEPQIVLACWMLRNEDWTKQMRTPSVEEYILIGPKDSGTCGIDDETWGMNQTEEKPAPYREAHFERIDLSDLSKMQLGQKDWGGWHFSSTVSFRRLPVQTGIPQSETNL